MSTPPTTPPTPTTNHHGNHSSSSPTTSSKASSPTSIHAPRLAQLIHARLERAVLRAEDDDSHLDNIERLLNDELHRVDARARTLENAAARIFSN
jgi:protein required for attachment to host cells